MRIIMLLWLFLIPFLANLFCSHVVLVAGQCQSDQQSLLLQLKSSLKFEVNRSVHLVKWNQNTDCCNWSGVNCDVGGRVIGLNLSNKSISGGIENSNGLFGLQQLRSLNLAFNRINASQIPSRLANLTNLTYLNLSNAGFAGQIPVEISSLTRLVTLDLSSQTFLGSILLKLENPNLKVLVQNLTVLRELIPSSTQLQSFLPTSFEGNEGLCGPPLTNECTTNSSKHPSPGPASSSEFDWKFLIAIGAGFGIGFVAAVASPVFFEKVDICLIFHSTSSAHLVRWHQTTDCCTWSGVDCDMAGHVIILDLSEESISGGVDNSAFSLFSIYGA
ncbi:hypothetical protein QYF36_009277 [Acer negundo]|nr:hypothetical protein QYF36_009277 [Acer negundo]